MLRIRCNTQIWTMAGEINPDIVHLVGTHGALAASITGIDGSPFVATQRGSQLGVVGEITRVNSDVIMRMLLEEWFRSSPRSPSARRVMCTT